jgi:hypothetical protein
MRNLVYFLLALSFLLYLSMFNYLIAQGPPGPPTGGGGPPCWPPSTCIPIDGGLSFLLVAGAVYGAKKMHNNFKSK